MSFTIPLLSSELYAQAKRLRWICAMQTRWPSASPIALTGAGQHLAT